MYYAYITRITNLRKHPNADRLQLGECFGNTVVVSLDYKNNQLGVYFPADGQLSSEFAEVNNLVRKKDENGNNIGGYMDPDKRNVTAIRLRGEKSDGLFLPLSSLDYCFNDHRKEDNEAVIDIAYNHLNEGDRIDVLNGHEICKKYMPRTNIRVGKVSDGNRTRKKKVPTAPLFAEHADTEQLAYNLGAFRAGDEIEITLKMHGTSQRTGYLPTLKGYKRTLLDRILRREGKPIYDWGYVSGTRRVVLDSYEGGFYGNNQFREQHSKIFEGKLWKGETAYYEVVGFTTNGTPIMASANNKKLNDKAFIKQYGEETVFSYGCRAEGMTLKHGMDEHGAYTLQEVVPQSDIYVYRMTMTNEDGDVVEYTPDFTRYRCEQMGVKCVPVMWKGRIPVDEEDFESFIPGKEDCVPQLVFLTPGEWIKEKAEEFYDGPDPIGKTHVREGVVVRILNRPKFTAYKHKNFSFKVLSGIAVEAVDPNTLTDDMLNEL